MAACVCYRCKRVMDCSGEQYCDLCQYDLEQQAARKGGNKPK